MISLWHHFVLFLAIVSCFGKAHCQEDDECDRYSLDEFYASVFRPLFNDHLDFLEIVVQQGSDAIEESLIGLEERKPEGQLGNVDGVKAAMNNVRQTAMVALHKGKFSIENEWEKVLESPTLSEMKERFDTIQEALEQIRSELKEPLEEMATSGHFVVNTMVTVLEGIVKKAPEEEHAHTKEKLLNSLKERGKLLGLILGKLVMAKLDDITMEQPEIMDNVYKVMSSMNDAFYRTGRKIPKVQFWQQQLQGGWNLVKGSQEYQLDDAVQQFWAALFYHSVEE